MAAGPRLAARALARAPRVSMGGGSARFSGYGLLALTFESGDVLAFRHYSSSSLGPPFNCVWHRDPAGRWTMHVDVAPARSTLPFFAPALHDANVGEIQVRWQGRYELSVAVSAARLSVAIRIAAAPRTRLLGAAAALVPNGVWHNPRAARALGSAAGALLGSGPLHLLGRAPAGHGYALRPAALWQVAAAAAVRGGHDLGSTAQPADSPLLGELPLPRRGLLAALSEEFAPAQVTQS